MKENVSVTRFSEWVEERGGVQEISLGKSATYIKPADKAEIEALKLELDKANGVAETVVAKMEELAKVGSNYTPPAQATVFREIETPKTIKEQMAERKLISKNK